MSVLNEHELEPAAITEVEGGDVYIGGFDHEPPLLNDAEWNSLMGAIPEAVERAGADTAAADMRPLLTVPTAGPTLGHLERLKRLEQLLERRVAATNYKDRDDADAGISTINTLIAADAEKRFGKRESP